MCVEPRVPSTSRQVVRPLEWPGRASVELDVLAPDEAISRAPVRELVRTGLAGHRGTPAGSTTAEAATVAAIPGVPS